MATYTEQDLANIKAAIAGGLTQAMINGEMVQYRSLPEMERIKALIEREIAGGASSRTAMPVRYASTADRGL